MPVVNVKGIGPGQLVLDGATLAAIYLGDIKSWNDPAIKKLNPKLTLPATAIAPIYRSDGSGTNFLFTDYLSKQSPKFKDSIGAATSVQWRWALAPRVTRAWPIRPPRPMRRGLR